MLKLIGFVVGLLFLVYLFPFGEEDKKETVFDQDRQSQSESKDNSSTSTEEKKSEGSNSTKGTQAQQQQTQEPEWKSTVEDVSSFIQDVPENRLEEEHRKLQITEDSYQKHKETAKFSIGMSKKVEEEAKHEQRMHIVKLSERIIATFEDLDRDFAVVEAQVQDVSWDSSAEKNRQLNRLKEYEELKEQYLQPALEMKRQYSR